MTTTTERAMIDGVEVVESEQNNLSRITEMLQSTTEALQLFPQLTPLTNIKIYCMNIWQAESRFDNWHPNNSRGLSIVSGTGQGNPVPDDISQWPVKSGFWAAYWNDPAVTAYRSVHGQTDGIVDGLYAHGVSQAMGAYHIEGCKASNDMFGSARYIGIASANGLLIPVGNRVTDIYTEDPPGRKKSIIAGLIVIDYWYSFWINKPMTPRTSKLIFACQGGYGTFPTNSNVNPSQAILLAVGQYLGFGSTGDANGTLGVNRAFNVVYGGRVWTYKASVSGTVSSTGSTSANALGCTK